MARDPGGREAEVWEAAAEVLRSLGRPGFGAALLRAAAGLLPVDHLSLFSFGPGLAPRLLLAESSGGSDVAVEAGRRYQAGGYHRFDPNMGHLQAHEASDGRSAGTAILRLTAADIRDGGYRSAIYDRFGLGERLSLLGMVEGRWLALNLYRQLSRGPCSPASLARLRDGAGFLAAAAGRHAGLTSAAEGRPAEAAGLLEQVLRAERLSPREAQVCARAVIGMTNLGIALELAVKESTVATLRRRAYGKLGIASVHELFLLCLRRLGAGVGESGGGSDQASRSL